MGKNLTKAQMVEKIQMAEEEAWEILNSYINIFGENDDSTIRMRAAWCSLFLLRESLGLEKMSYLKSISQE